MVRQANIVPIVSGGNIWLRMGICWSSSLPDKPNNCGIRRFKNTTQA